jgi:hypothetical protein
MNFTGEVKGIARDWNTNKFNITFSINESSVVNEIDMLKDSKLSIKAVKYRQKRSLDANGLLWHCLGEIASSLNADKWDIYLQMLKRYGKYTYICVKPNMVDSVRSQWRESEVIGEVNINGSEAVQMLCYFGSSTYNTKEFSVLLEGVISEMQEMGLVAPLSQDMKRALEEWERKTQNEKAV